MIIYDKKIYEQFRINKPDVILKQYLYDFRYNQHDSNFNFLIGLCLLNMGYLYESFVAFNKSVDCDKLSNRNKLFVAVTLLKAQKYHEVRKYIKKNISCNELKPSELSVYIDIQSRLKEDTSLPIKSMENIVKKDDSIENKIFLIYSYLFSSQKKYFDKKLNNILKEINLNDFKDFQQYVDVLTEFYKLNLPNSYLYNLINKINISDLSIQDTIKYLKMIYGLNFYQNMDKINKNRICKQIKKHYPNNDNIGIQINCMNYDEAESIKDNQSMTLCINKLNQYKTINNNEQGLLYIITDALKKNKIESHNAIVFKNRIEHLIKLDSTNIKYRRLYFEFLLQLGFVEQSKIITEATLNLQKKEEKEEFELIKKFHAFYLPDEYCIFNESQKNHKDECPLCFGTEHMPIIKTIAFGHSPNEIFSDNVVRRKIEVDEKTLGKIVDWQPMNVPSKIIGKYLQKLGAYTTTHDFPKVLVPGQTYIFIYLKNEAFKRLAKEGFSLEQIDPLYNLFKGINKYKLKDNNIFSKEPKKISNYDNLINSNDFVIEIIKSITKE